MTHKERFIRRQKIAEAVRNGSSIPEVAQAFGVTSEMVFRSVRDFGGGAVGHRERWKRMAEKMASGSTFHEAIMEFKVTEATIRRACKEHGVSLKHLRRKPAPDDARLCVKQREWDGIDWGKLNDTEIAKIVGVTSERVRQKRKSLGKPKSNNYHQSGSYSTMVKWLEENRESLATMTAQEVAEMTPFYVRAQTIERHCGRLGITLKARSLVGSGLTVENLGDYVTERLVVSQLGPCWELKIGHRSADYMRVGSQYGHRLVYSLFYGDPPPERPWVLHHCDNPKCVNPKHLYAGTPLDNARDRMIRGRSKSVISKVNAAEVLRIYRLGGKSCVRLGKQFGVSSSTIWKIVNGKTHASDSALESIAS